MGSVRQATPIENAHHAQRLRALAARYRARALAPSICDAAFVRMLLVCESEALLLAADVEDGRGPTARSAHLVLPQRRQLRRSTSGSP